ncbi:MAG: cyclopropane-fatty-acyl-phospholipid synthase family protein [Caldimonas sp.]
MPDTRRLPSGHDVERTPWAPTNVPAAARAVLRLLERLRHGSLELRLPDGTSARFGSRAAGEPHAAMRLANWNVFGAALKAGDIGVAESYIAGDWTSPDLPALLGLFIANRDAIESVVYGSWWGSLLHRLRHFTHRNSRRGSRRNIQAHYDLGNAFYRLWLDPTMSYSSAWFEGDRSADLVEAQWAKTRRALTECRVKPGDRVLEIGCGWGALAECAARDFGATVHGVTLSAEQLAWGRERLAAAQLPSQLELRDYRDLDSGRYDAIASIEMFEAVGREYWPGFFAVVRDRLKPGGRACIQSITIRDDLFERYVGSTDFIQQYIFPGGLLPSVPTFKAAAAAAGLAVVEELDFGLDYAETLRRWREAFFSAEDPVRQLGFDTRFVRIWDFYLAYCEAAFETGNTSVVQFTLQHT